MYELKMNESKQADYGNYKNTKELLRPEGITENEIMEIDGLSEDKHMKIIILNNLENKIERVTKENPEAIIWYNASYPTKYPWRTKPNNWTDRKIRKINIHDPKFQHENYIMSNI
jgi:hypothetical protein